MDAAYWASLDISETDGEIQLQLDAPGMEAEEIDSMGEGVTVYELRRANAYYSCNPSPAVFCTPPVDVLPGHPVQ